MDKSILTKAWILSGLEDLFFAFPIDFEPHRPYRLFNEILALEKILKSFLFFYESDRYSSLCEKQAKKTIENIAKKEYGHDIKLMLKKVSNHLGSESIKELKEKEFDGFKGHEFILAIKAGYFESRYPTLEPIYEKFKVKGVEIYRDPLESTGITKFIYAVFRLLLNDLRKKVDLTSVKEQFFNTYKHMSEFDRFMNSAFLGSLENFF